MAVLPDLDTSIYNILANDAGVAALVSAKIYNLQAPFGSALPYLVFYEAVGIIPNITPRDTLDDTYRIESRAGTRAAASGLHLAVYTAVHEQALTITGWSNYWLVCERSQRFIENVDGAQYWRFVWDIRAMASKD